MPYILGILSISHIRFFKPSMNYERLEGNTFYASHTAIL
jgi:hypothetical protein